MFNQRLMINNKFAICYLRNLVIAIIIYSSVATVNADNSIQMQKDRWETAKVKPKWQEQIDRALRQFERNKIRYKNVEMMRPNGVPALVVFALHGRESSWRFHRHLHEGSPLSHKTRNVPKGRPLGIPPFTWEQSAEDALYVLKKMDKVTWAELPIALQAIEGKYNGYGYQKYHPDVPSPYLWSGTTIYSRGKYVADKRFDPFAVDKQIGCAAILKRKIEKEKPAE